MLRNSQRTLSVICLCRGRCICQSLHLRSFSIYTERQKKLITSSERHSLKSTASELIIFGHRLAIHVVILIKHIYKNKSLLESKRRKIWWNRKRSIFKNHRNCSPLESGVCRRQKPVRWLYNPPLKLNE